MAITDKKKQPNHVLVQDALHKKLKILSAETGVTMKALIHSAIILLLEFHMPSAKKEMTGSGSGGSRKPYFRNS